MGQNPIGKRETKPNHLWSLKFFFLATAWVEPRMRRDHVPADVVSHLADATKHRERNQSGQDSFWKKQWKNKKTPSTNKRTPLLLCSEKKLIAEPSQTTT